MSCIHLYSLPFAHHHDYPAGQLPVQEAGLEAIPPDATPTCGTACCDYVIGSVLRQSAFLSQFLEVRAILGCEIQCAWGP